MNSPKQAAAVAWKNAISDEKLSPLCRAIQKALRESRHVANTFKYAHDLGRFANSIAKAREHHPSGTLDYSLWKGRWYVSNADLNAYATFQMWMSRSAPAGKDGFSCETSRIGTALKRKRMQQAYYRYQKTGLRKEHCLLLAAAIWEIDTSRGDWVSLFVQGKRPFGDSSRARQIYRLVGWPDPAKGVDRCLTAKEEERAWDLFDELAFAAKDAAIKAGKLTAKDLNKDL